MEIAEKKGKLFIISGPSGTGKGTICKALLERNDIDISVSMTTRTPREGEIHGVSYYFATREEFEQTIAEGGFLEYADVFGNYYGTPKAMVVEKLQQGRDVILEIDVQGAIDAKKVYPESILIFILPPSLKELRARIEGRGTETEEVINLRLSKALEEMSYIDKYDYFVVNDIIDDAIIRTEAIMHAEHGRVVPEDVKYILDKYKEEEKCYTHQ
ncbi:MAG: guanylate kinase [Eubacteriaceae bacterium]|nr:guanylate kinase [Eubacteriaceae bacterium]